MFDSSIASPMGARGEEPDETLATAELADELVAIARQASVAECHWLALLALFDRREGWRVDGQLSCVDWLAWRCGLARRTAREKLRVAHELRRRPAVRAAFARGELSYAKVRAITRVEGADEETDARLLEVAAEATATDLERLARHYEYVRDQERGVDDYLARFDRRSLHASRTYDGMLVIDLTPPPPPHGPARPRARARGRAVGSCRECASECSRSDEPCVESASGRSAHAGWHGLVHEC